MKHHPKRERVSQKARPSISLLERIQPDAAGIDCGQHSHYVAVPPDRDPQPVRAFRSFTGELERLADWLARCRIKTVAMESTGVFWIPLHEILEQRGFEVMLVNARDVHNVRGRKSDVMDCEWLRELHSVGLLRPSFRPAAAIVPLRSFMRHESATSRLEWRTLRRWRTPDSLLLPIAHAIANFVTSEDLSHVKSCEKSPCTLFFLDRTRGQVRRWCSMALCGNRAKQALYRSRSKRRRHSARRERSTKT